MKVGVFVIAGAVVFTIAVLTAFDVEFIVPPVNKTSVAGMSPTINLPL